VFGKALAEYEGSLGVDQVVLVRGRVDHKEAGRTCLVVQTVEPFRPSDEDIERARANGSAPAQIMPVHLHVDATQLPASIIEELKQVLASFPGESEVVLEMSTRTGL